MTIKIESNKNQLEKLSSAQKLQSLEFKYCAAADEVSRDFDKLARLFYSLNKIYRRIEKYSLSISNATRNNHTAVKDLFTQYMADIKAIHQRNIYWLALYLDYNWPLASNDINRSRINKDKLKRRLKKIIPEAWRLLNENHHTLGHDKEKIKKIVKLHKVAQETQKKSLEWRKPREKFNAEMYYALIGSLMHGKHSLNNNFRIKLYQNFLSNDENLSIEEKSELNDKISHWVKGYCDNSNKTKNLVETGNNFDFIKELKMSQIVRRIKLTIKTFTIFVITILMIFTLHHTDLDNKFMRLLVSTVKKGMSIDFNARRIKGKKEFFEKQLLDLNQTYTPEEVKKAVEDFYVNDTHLLEDGRYLFTQNILKGFLFLLAAEKADKGLIEDVYFLARRFDYRTKVDLEKIVSLYQQEAIRETELRKRMFNLRRHFILEDVYPFMFMVLNNGTPYIFLYPEKIIDTFELNKTHYDRLGIDPYSYKGVRNIRVRALYMKGKNYPFKTVSGYFEGEFAVVFTDLSLEPDWTALHEVGHVVENMRYRFEYMPAPINVELNGMLFPMIFADDAKDYVLTQFFRMINKGDIKDYYLQASKGILNGITRYLAEVRGEEPLHITNKLEQDRIDLIRSKIENLSTTQIQGIGVVLYNNPSKYLSTADRGRYRAVLTNTKELTYGSHVSPEKDIILMGANIMGLADLLKGPQLIMDTLDLFDENAAVYVAALRDAILVFIFVEIFAFLLHVLGTPIRKKKYHGRLVRNIIHHVIYRNYWFKQESSNIKSKAEKLLIKLLNSKGTIDDKFRHEVEEFKLKLSSKSKIIFTMLLSLAPQIPQKSVIIKEFHLIWFYIPFIGPYFARFRWFWFKQKFYVLREKYNRRLEKLLLSVKSSTKVEDLMLRYDELLSKFKVGGKVAIHKEEKYISWFNELENLIINYINEEIRKTQINKGKAGVKDGGGSLKNLEGLEFDRLEKYIPGHDIRDIDWNVTARMVNGDVIVRRRIQKQQTKISFLFDLAGLQEKAYRKVIAIEFIKSLKLLNQNRTLESLLIIMPNGEVFQENINLNGNNNLKQNAKKIISRLKERFNESPILTVENQIDGLKFYDEKENEEFRQILSLADTGIEHQKTEGQIRIFRAKIENIILIGVKAHRRKIIASLIGRKKGFYWQGTHALSLKV